MKVAALDDIEIKISNASQSDEHDAANLSIDVADKLKSIYARLKIGTPIHVGDLIKAREFVQAALATIDSSEVAGSQIPPHRVYLPGAVRGGLAGWQIKAVDAAIRAKLDSQICVADLAKLTRLSESHFSRAFRISCGMSPKQYILKHRIEAAKSLLLETDVSISEVALNCGFCDQAHFTRVFHTMTGEAPGRWQRMRRVDMAPQAIRPSAGYVTGVRI